MLLVKYEITDYEVNADGDETAIYSEVLRIETTDNTLIADLISIGWERKVTC